MACSELVVFRAKYASGSFLGHALCNKIRLGEGREQILCNTITLEDHPNILIT